MENIYIDRKDKKRKLDFNNSNFSIVDQKVLDLKIFEYDYNHFIEVITAYLIAQEVIVKNLFGEIEVIIINIAQHF
jgi:hypothetical protein